MKVCEHCGDQFQPKFPNAKLCSPCWIERENAFQLVDELKAENAKLLRKVQRLESAKPRKARAKETTITAIPPDVLKLLVLLAHPDKHDNSPASTKATAWLLSARKP